MKCGVLGIPNEEFNSIEVQITPDSLNKRIKCILEPIRRKLWGDICYDGNSFVLRDWWDNERLRIHICSGQLNISCRKSELNIFKPIVAEIHAQVVEYHKEVNKEDRKFKVIIKTYQDIE